MRRIKTVKLAFDYADENVIADKETELFKQSYNWHLCSKFNNGTKTFSEDQIRNSKTKIFEVVYEDDRFEVEEPINDNELLYYLCSDGDIVKAQIYERSYRFGSVGTLSEMKYRKMYWETMHYMRKLAEELNGNWRYEAGKQHQALYNFKFELYLDGGWMYNSYHGLKFSPNVKIEQIIARAKPEMLENYKKICKNPY